MVASLFASEETRQELTNATRLFIGGRIGFLVSGRGVVVGFGMLSFTAMLAGTLGTIASLAIFVRTVAVSVSRSTARSFPLPVGLFLFISSRSVSLILAFSGTSVLPFGAAIAILIAFSSPTTTVSAPVSAPSTTTVSITALATVSAPSTTTVSIAASWPIAVTVSITPIALAPSVFSSSAAFWRCGVGQIVFQYNALGERDFPCWVGHGGGLAFKWSLIGAIPT